jgi:hypothetical protein
VHRAGAGLADTQIRSSPRSRGPSAFRRRVRRR